MNACNVSDQIVWPVLDVNTVLGCVFGNYLNLCEQTGKNNINFI